MVGGGYCWLQMPLKPALAVRETVAEHRLGALGGLEMVLKECRFLFSHFLSFGGGDWTMMMGNLLTSSIFTTRYSLLVSSHNACPQHPVQTTRGTVSTISVLVLLFAQKRGGTQL